MLKFWVIVAAYVCVLHVVAQLDNMKLVFKLMEQAGLPSVKVNAQGKGNFLYNSGFFLTTHVDLHVD